MQRIFATLLVVTLFSLPAWSQDQPAEPQPAEREDGATEPAEDDETDAAGPVVDLDEDPDLDQQTYEKDDDEFVPTEEIPVDQAIPFPTDI